MMHWIGQSRVHRWHQPSNYPQRQRTSAWERRAHFVRIGAWSKTFEINIHIYRRRFRQNINISGLFVSFFVLLDLTTLIKLNQSCYLMLKQTVSLSTEFIVGCKCIKGIFWQSSVELGSRTSWITCACFNSVSMSWCFC